MFLPKVGQIGAPKLLTDTWIKLANLRSCLSGAKRSLPLLAARPISFSHGPLRHFPTAPGQRSANRRAERPFAALLQCSQALVRPKEPTTKHAGTLGEYMPLEPSFVA